MSDQDQTINEVAAPSPVQANDELIDTIDEPVVPSLEAAPKTDEEVKAETPAAEVKESVKESDEDRFDKHPRFQELIKSKNELKKEMEALKAQVAATAAPKEPKEPAFKDISGMTDEEIQEWMDVDPKGYQANLTKQITENVRREIEAKVSNETAEQRILRTFNTYADANPTFDPMWDSGDIQAFMGANPGHNAISAHMAMTVETRIKEAVEKAQKDTEEKVIKNFKAKKNAQVLGAGPASTGTAQDRIAPELKDPKKYGGINTVLAARLAERRKAG